MSSKKAFILSVLMMSAAFLATLILQIAFITLGNYIMLEIIKDIIGLALIFGCCYASYLMAYAWGF
mgnify:CR=1 FL=1